ncbi:hypothetical protein [Vibrio alginolyticus]|uniref:hypothetical protein n=1 Tax=Vibrio alginolyticus TaxID=663 RepID=UPI0006CA7853|nr:hypothetical protein [Vibrio alginolyticus]KPM97450.1 hypothetical protein AOG25_13315 [Vibrio alginolyticus]CAH7183896.1 conserved exported hypothetical protein [Vibrio chagasii]CAH7352969.1 conserved exported hypothetical protein [Vibrio chagasii]
MFKKLIFVALTLLPLPSVADSTDADSVIEYVNSLGVNDNIAVKSEYVIRAIDRVLSENWLPNENSQPFRSISDDMDLSVACFLEDAKKYRVSEELLNDIQELMINTPNKRTIYRLFVDVDLETKNKKPNIKMCRTLV